MHIREEKVTSFYCPSNYISNANRALCEPKVQHCFTCTLRDPFDDDGDCKTDILKDIIGLWLFYGRALRFGVAYSRSLFIYIICLGSLHTNFLVCRRYEINTYSIGAIIY